jgi:hypothetical protein
MKSADGPSAREAVSMSVRVRVEAEAVDRLAELGLSVEIVQRTIQRADAEAALCTPMDPPSMEGWTRWGRTTRYLREELVPAGWAFDNPRNLARTVHPSGEFAVVATSGDAMTGRAQGRPTTRNPKGEATERAVQVNEQLTLDLGNLIRLPGSGRTDDTWDLRTWYLLYYADREEFRVELSLPATIQNGWITDWIERIILPPLPRQDTPVAAPASPDDEDPFGEIVVEVNRR